MILAEFATKMNLKSRQDSCGDQILIPGKARRLPEDESHIYELSSGDGRLGLCLFLDTKRRWSSTKKRLLSAGMVLLQDGDFEGCLSFDPENEVQARLAIREARICKRKEFTAKSLAERSARMKARWEAAAQAA